MMVVHREHAGRALAEGRLTATSPPPLTECESHPVVSHAYEHPVAFMPLRSTAGGHRPSLTRTLKLCCMDRSGRSSGGPLMSDEVRGSARSSVVAREAQAGGAVPSVQHSEHFPIGLRVRSRYRVVSELGAGAFGTVCLGEDESTGHRVAIRFLPRSFADSPSAAQAVLRMGRSIISTSTFHPGMVRVLEFGEVDAGRPFTVVEFVEGHRLSEMLSGVPPLEVAAAMRLVL